MTMHDGPGEDWMLARMDRVRQLRALTDDHDRPEPGWRRRLDRATTERATDPLDDLDGPDGVTLD